MKTLKSKRAGPGFYFKVVKLIASEGKEEPEMSAEKRDYFYNLTAVIHISRRLKRRYGPARIITTKSSFVTVIRVISSIFQTN